MKKNRFEFDVHKIVKIGGIEVWMSNETINNWQTDSQIIEKLGIREVYRDWNLAAIFKGRNCWVLFVLDENKGSLVHAYIPDPDCKYTLKQIIELAKILKQRYLK